MDVSDAEELARRLIARHLGPEWKFRWDQAKTRLGACHHRDRTISLSQPYVRLNGLAETTDTILHEIAHALTPGAGHGPAWKKAAARLGARPSSRADPRSVTQPAPRWVAICSTCTATLWRYRRPSTPMACARCCRRHSGGRFDPAFLLRWKPVKEARPTILAPDDRASSVSRAATGSAWKAPLAPPTQLDLFTPRP